MKNHAVSLLTIIIDEMEEQGKIENDEEQEMNGYVSFSLHLFGFKEDWEG